ncbi:helix-turn-helix domain-containing protein [Marmoricola sp. Leaf446]|uniref:helix-turn-helix domain-containing protein n=1 Tax=Marmoricola sp. Leaf446 TaxID=1736379 RepID=UPI0021008368|nr:helix-turn-helix domain-containing protein [Marmoricola sp. Leaf446]
MNPTGAPGRRGVGTGLDQPGEQLLTPGAVADLLHVDRRTVARWVRAVKLASIRTPGGHHRFRSSDVVAIRAGAYERLDHAREEHAATSVPRASAESLAAAVVAEAVAVALEVEAHDAALAVEQLRAEALDAAERAASAAAKAAGARAFAAETAARTLARDAARTATRVRVRADVAASQVAAAAGAALDARVAAGEDVDGERLAALAAQARSAADTTTRDVARAAVVVAAAVADAAARTARTTAAAEVLYADEVARAARELLLTASVAADRTRRGTESRAAGVALAARGAAAALQAEPPRPTGRDGLSPHEVGPGSGTRP